MTNKTKSNKRKKSSNPWLDHLKAYKKAHPNKPYGECMAAAKKTYTKIK